ncbi:MAG: SHOCT domain-containing protein [Trueperaceae bacterium]
MMGYGGWGMGGFGGFGMILFWILAVLAIIWLVRALDIGRVFPRNDERRSTGGSDDDKALTILRERYARGEIDTDEFDRRKRDLFRKDEP